MTLEVTWESLERITPEWLALEEESNGQNFFHSTVWHHASAGYRNGTPEEHSVLAVRRAGALAAIAPLHETEGRVTFSLDFNLTDYQDLLASKGEERAAWESVLAFGRDSGWSRIEFVGLREDSVSASLIPEVAIACGWKPAVDVWDVSPYLALPGSWDEYLQGLGKKDRHELRRKFRRLEESGEVRYEVLDRWTDATHEALGTFMELMAKSGDEKARFLTDDKRGFMITMARATAEAGALRLCFLQIDGKRVSGTLSFADGDRWLLYNSGYDSEYRQQAVGLLLKAWTIRYAIENGFREYDFLRGDEAYKYDLGGGDRKLFRFVLER